MASVPDVSDVALFQMPSATSCGTEVPAKATLYEMGNPTPLVSKNSPVLHRKTVAYFRVRLDDVFAPN